MADLRLLALTHLIAAGAGFALAPRELLETEVVQTGFFTTDTKRVLAAAVDSIRSENKLLVYSYKGFAAVSVERDGFLMFDGAQDLIVPAAVSYYIDLSRFTQEMVSYDELARTIVIQLPRLVMGDVTFEPQAARTLNGGLLTWNQDQVDELSRLAYRAAHKAMVKQAQEPELIEAAEASGERAVKRYIAIPLRIAGLGNVKVTVRIGDGSGPQSAQAS